MSTSRLHTNRSASMPSLDEQTRKVIYYAVDDDDKRTKMKVGDVEFLEALRTDSIDIVRKHCIDLGACLNSLFFTSNIDTVISSVW